MIMSLIPIITISGYRETRRNSTGMEALQVLIKFLFGECSSVFDLRSWDADWLGLARMIQRRGHDEVIIVGYSWGFGYAAVKLAKELEKLGISVRLMISCDGVYRPTWLPTFLPANILAVRALLPGSAKIRVPRNVRRVAGVRQRVDSPCGHDIVGVSEATRVERLVELPWPHGKIDESAEFETLVIREIKKELGL